MPTYTPSNTPYQGRGFDELVKPFQMYADRVRQYDTIAQSYADNISALRAMLPEDDDKSLKMLSDAEASYQSALNSLYENGLSLNDKNNFLNARRSYQNNVVPIGVAIEKYQKDMDAHKAMFENDDIRFKTGKDPRMFMPSDYLNGNNPPIGYVSGEELKKYAGDIAKSFYNTAIESKKGTTNPDGTGYSKTYSLEGILHPEQHVENFRQLVNSGNIDAAMKLDGGIWWNLYQNLKNEYGINEDNYNQNDLFFLNNKIIDGMYEGAKGSSSSSSITDNSPTRTGGGSGDGSGGGSGTNGRPTYADGWTIVNTSFGMNGSGELEHIKPIYRTDDKGKHTGEMSWGLAVPYKVKKEGGKTIEKRLRGISFDKFLEMKDGKVVLKSDDEIRKIIGNLNEGGLDESHSQLRDSQIRYTKYYNNGNVKKSWTEDAVLRDKFKTKDWQVENRYLKDIKSVYKSITENFGDQYLIDDFMSLGAMSTGSSGYQSEYRTAFSGAETEIKNHNLNRNMIQITDDEDFDVSQMASSPVFVTTLNDGNVGITYTADDGSSHSAVLSDAFFNKFPDLAEYKQHVKDDNQKMNDAAYLRSIEGKVLAGGNLDEKEKKKTRETINKYRPILESYSTIYAMSTGHETQIVENNGFVMIYDMNTGEGILPSQALMEDVRENKQVDRALIARHISGVNRQQSQYNKNN